MLVVFGNLVEYYIAFYPIPYKYRYVVEIDLLCEQNQNWKHLHTHGCLKLWTFYNEVLETLDWETIETDNRGGYGRITDVLSMWDTHFTQTYKIVCFELSFLEGLVGQLPLFFSLSLYYEVHIPHQLVTAEYWLTLVEDLLYFIFHQPFKL